MLLLRDCVVIVMFFVVVNILAVVDGILVVSTHLAALHLVLLDHG